MRGKRFTEEQIIRVLREVEQDGVTVAEVCKKHGVSEQSYYRWKNKYGGLDYQLGFTRARVTQILDLTLLAPDIQEQVLNLEAIDGREPLSERGIREVVGRTSWEEQRKQWAVLGL